MSILLPSVTCWCGHSNVNQHWREIGLRFSWICRVKVYSVSHQYSWQQKVFAMAVFYAKTNCKQIAIISSLIRSDCIVLYRNFGAIKTQLKSAIELYEEFMTDEVNALFQCNKNFSDIVLKHRIKFNQFVEETAAQFTNETVSHTNGNGASADDNVYVLFISLQEWLTQGPKGQQFYFMIDIDAFNLTKLMKCPTPTNATPKVWINKSKQSKTRTWKAAWIFYFADEWHKPDDW